MDCRPAFAPAAPPPHQNETPQLQQAASLSDRGEQQPAAAISACHREALRAWPDPAAACNRAVASLRACCSAAAGR